MIKARCDVVQEEEEEEEDDYPELFLQVPSRRASRRLSSVTCSSADTSYLERRGSAMEVGLPPPPALRRPPLPYETWDFYYPIDIQVPTQAMLPHPQQLPQVFVYNALQSSRLASHILPKFFISFSFVHWLATCVQCCKITS